MKTILQVLFFLTCGHMLQAQITSQSIKAGFGADGELRANFFNGISQPGNDDWFSNSFGSGQFVIDTTGAAAIVSQYTTDINSRRIPFFRTMRVDPYSLLNNFMVIDAVFIRDYHGDDSTIFASGSNKNGMSPAAWTCPVSQSIPDKNEILDMMVHVRRAGPNPTDSLWMFGGVSIENTTGNRYFDFEMYQTDIYYDRVSRKFYGYGPDAGHTAWLFDGAGNITRPGDIIFSAEYSSSTLTKIEARIWVDQAVLSTTPSSFSWTGSFDGATSGSQYGYAGIGPKTAGAFYTGLSSSANTWAGPFSLVKGDNSVVTTYTAAQFMEFSVNLSKLGLDPVTLLGSDQCGMPFRRVLVKSRSSVSFTAELKDFVGPFDFFLAPRASADADVPYYCGTMGVSQLQVVNPVSTSVYTWSTLDGNFVGSTSGPYTTVNTPGTYIVRQQLQSGCSTYALDTVVVAFDPNCALLPQNFLDFRSAVDKKQVQLSWTVADNHDVHLFEVERSTNGVDYTMIGKVPVTDTLKDYSAADELTKIFSSVVYYRLKVVDNDNRYSYSRILKVNTEDYSNKPVSIHPNPVKQNATIQINSDRFSSAKVCIYNIHGKLLKTIETSIRKGSNTVTVSGVGNWQSGIYPVKVHMGENVFTELMALTK